MKPGAEFFAEIIGGEDPARVSEAADRAANLLVRGARGTDDPEVAERVLHLAETEGIETIAEVWAGSPADSLAGCLWRLFVLRSWVYADPAAVAREYDAGRRTAQVAQVVAGVADPPGPDELRTMVDEVLRGIAGSDFADVLFRAAAFARVVATGRAALDDGATSRSTRWRGCWCWPSSSRRRVTWSSRTAWLSDRLRRPSHGSEMRFVGLVEFAPVWASPSRWLGLRCQVPASQAQPPSVAALPGGSTREGGDAWPQLGMTRLAFWALDACRTGSASRRVAARSG